MNEPDPEPPEASASADTPGAAMHEYARILKRRSGLIRSFGCALDGVLRTLLTERNMKIHWLSGLAVMLVGMTLPFDLSARASLMFCVALVLSTEVLNTALEAFVDLHVRDYARTALVAKDAAAAAVLILSTGAVIVFADIVLHKWGDLLRNLDAVRRTVIFGGPLLAIVGALLFWRASPGRNLLSFGLSIGLIAVLAYHSRDEVFTAGAIGFVTIAVYARVSESRLLKKPPTAD